MSAAPSSPPSARVMLHVGTPKSGTTFLQRTLWTHRDRLREAGFLVPGTRGPEMFEAAIEVREAFSTWGYDRESLTGTWNRLCARARDFDGTTIMSHELLAAATEDEIERALADLRGLDVHVVVTVRDLSRQIMSEWQERIKNGGTQPFARFQKSVNLKRLSADPEGTLFWRYHNIPGILSRWGGGLPPGNVHVVVSPGSGADPRELWLRFGRALGVDSAVLESVEPAGVPNQSLGTVQIAVLRRVNEALAGRIVQPAYARVVKRLFAQNLLAGHPSPRPSCPPELLTELRAVSERWIHEIRERGYTVHGDLADLMPPESAPDASDPDDVDARAEAELAEALIADLLVEVGKLRGRLRRQASPEPDSAGGRMARWRRRVPRPVRVAARSLRRG